MGNSVYPVLFAWNNDRFDIKTYARLIRKMRSAQKCNKKVLPNLNYLRISSFHGIIQVAVALQEYAKLCQVVQHVLTTSLAH